MVVRAPMKPRVAWVILLISACLLILTVLTTLQRQLVVLAALSDNGLSFHAQGSAWRTPPLQRTVPFDPSAPIPHRLWQISRSKLLTTEQAKAVKTWYDQNPDMLITLYDDAMADAFILDF